MRQLMERLGEQLKALDRQVGEPGEHVRKRRLELRLTKKQAVDWLGANARTILNCVAIDEFYSNFTRQACVKADIDSVSTVRGLARELIVEGSTAPRAITRTFGIDATPDRGQAVNFMTRLRPCSLATYMARSARAWMASMLRPSSG